jgi:hypothetical protein
VLRLGPWKPMLRPVVSRLRPGRFVREPTSVVLVSVTGPRATQPCRVPSSKSFWTIGVWAAAGAAHSAKKLAQTSQARAGGRTSFTARVDMGSSGLQLGLEGPASVNSFVGSSVSSSVKADSRRSHRSSVKPIQAFHPFRNG